MPGKHETERNGHETTPQGGAALRIASRGLSSIRDLTNFTAAIAVDALTGHVGSKNGNLAVRGMEATRRFIDVGQKHGQHTNVLDRITTADECEVDPDLEKERELTAQLETLRERRGRQNVD